MGDVDSSMACINEATSLKKSRDEIIEGARGGGDGAGPGKSKKQVVCEVPHAQHHLDSFNAAPVPFPINHDIGRQHVAMSMVLDHR